MVSFLSVVDKGPVQLFFYTVFGSKEVEGSIIINNN